MESTASERSIGPLRMGIVREPDGETRVAATPDTVARLAALGYTVVVESGAGARASFPNAAYVNSGATIVDRADAWNCDVVLRINPPSPDDIARLKDGADRKSTRLNSSQTCALPIWCGPPCSRRRGR